MQFLAEPSTSTFNTPSNMNPGGIADLLKKVYDDYAIERIVEMPNPFKFHVGDEVECIESSGSSVDFRYTKGKLYKVEEFAKHGDSAEWNSIKDDKGQFYIANAASVSRLFKKVDKEEILPEPISSAFWESA